MATTQQQVQQSSQIDQSSKEKYQKLFDSIPTDGVKCDILFLVIRNRLYEEPEYVRKLRNVFVFNILKEGNLVTTWTVDTKKCIEGEVYRGEPRDGIKADVILTVEDEDWVKIMVGKLNPQRAFMMGKFRIKGNIMLLQKLHSLWYDLRKNGRAPEMDLMLDIMVNETIIKGLKSEAMSVEFVSRLVRMPNVCDLINAIVQINILKDGRMITIYSLDTKIGEKVSIRRGEPPSKPDVTFTVEDDDLILLLYKIKNFEEELLSGRIQYQGDKDAAIRVKHLFTHPTIMSRL